MATDRTSPKEVAALLRRAAAYIEECRSFMTGWPSVCVPNLDAPEPEQREDFVSDEDADALIESLDATAEAFEHKR